MDDLKGQATVTQWGEHPCLSLWVAGFKTGNKRSSRNLHQAGYGILPAKTDTMISAINRISSPIIGQLFVVRKPPAR
jgi:hypothetical protein